mgnify:CR=1 FL=1
MSSKLINLSNSNELFLYGISVVSLALLAKKMTKQILFLLVSAILIGYSVMSNLALSFVIGTISAYVYVYLVYIDDNGEKIAHE